MCNFISEVYTSKEFGQTVWFENSVSYVKVSCILGWIHLFTNTCWKTQWSGLNALLWPAADGLNYIQSHLQLHYFYCYFVSALKLTVTLIKSDAPKIITSLLNPVEWPSLKYIVHLLYSLKLNPNMAGFMCSCQDLHAKSTVKFKFPFTKYISTC